MVSSRSINSGSVSSASPSAARLLASSSTVVAPRRTTSAQGCASTTASARASGVLSASRAASTSSKARPRAVSLPFASGSFTMTQTPAAWAAASAEPAAGSSKFHVACTVSNPPTSSARSIVSACLGPVTDSPLTVHEPAAAQVPRAPHDRPIRRCQGWPSEFDKGEDWVREVLGSPPAGGEVTLPRGSSLRERERAHSNLPYMSSPFRADGGARSVDRATMIANAH